MLSVAGLSGAGVARHVRSSSPERSSTSTPRSMLSTTSAASMLEDGDHQPLEKEPASEGILKIIDHVHLQHDVLCCKYSEDGSMVAVGLKDGSIKVFSSETGAQLYNLVDSETKESHLPCTSLNFRHHLEGDKSQNVLLATYASGMVKLWHTASRQCLHTIHEPRQTLAAAFDVTTSLFVTTGSDEKVFIYDANTTQIVNTCQPSPSMGVMDGHRSRVFCVKFHPRNVKEFVTGGWDDTIQFWDTREEHATRRIYGPHICGDALDIDPVHNHILTGSWRKTNSLQIWDYASGSCVKSVPSVPGDINSLIYCTQWLGKEHIVAGGCDANMVKLIDRGTFKTTGRIVDLSRGVYCLHSNPVGTSRRFAIGFSSSLLFLQIKPTM
ncbi:uncharacterized WD repeat-containing protein alr3466-like [Lytechinus pictus]|uniref:uncharacterized WD repeat-containing protein alr3466-like n=1 Tax=Lytechinus pictus TaxID=7653 RepID=UPI0030B9DEBA